jgi:hypothetical protein
MYGVTNRRIEVLQRRHKMADDYWASVQTHASGMGITQGL